MKITLLGNPYSTNNIYFRAGKRGFIKAKPKAQKESYILQARTQKKGFLSNDVGIKARLYFGDRRKRDIDNFNKLWMDALSGVIYEDDKQIQEMYLKKDYDKENPRIELEIYEL